MKFQSAPRVAAGRNRVVDGNGKRVYHVSIRSPRCRGEKPQWFYQRRSWPRGFESAPRVAAGRNAGVPARICRVSVFQSAPRVAAGRNVLGPAPSLTSRLFQSAPRVAAGRNFIQTTENDLPHLFQSAPRVAAGRNGAGLQHQAHNPVVSIRSPRCRGEKHCQRTRPIRSCSFNPLPALPRGETALTLAPAGAPRVSIRSPRCRGEKQLSQSFGPVCQCFNPLPALPRGETTIADGSATIDIQFQSAPRVAAGRNDRPQLTGLSVIKFQSARIGYEKAMLDNEAYRPLGHQVSIRSPRCRGEKPPCTLRVLHAKVFQSAPRVAAGRNAHAAASISKDMKFQSAPRVAAGRNPQCGHRQDAQSIVSIRSPRCRGEKPWSGCRSYGRRTCFNPLPALPRGETIQRPEPGYYLDVSIRSPRCRGEKRRSGVRHQIGQWFQSAPRVAAGRNHQLRQHGGHYLHVSIRSPRCRGEKPWGGSAGRRGRRSFNPLPALPRGETPSPLGASHSFLWFQSAPRVAAGRNSTAPPPTPCCSMFQSAPRVAAGRNEIIQAEALRSLVFQSAPRVAAGRNPERASVETPMFLFQSAPRVAAGRNDLRSHADLLLRLFQSAPRVAAGRNRLTRHAPLASLMFQSAPRVAAGRNPQLQRPASSAGKFQSAPRVAAGRNANPLCEDCLEEVSIRSPRCRGEKLARCAQSSK